MSGLAMVNVKKVPRAMRDMINCMMATSDLPNFYLSCQSTG
jgi:hypothetical protein